MTLSGEKAKKEWMQIVIDSPNGALKTKLAVKQILLGHDAKKDEVNVVEVTTDSWKRDGSENTIPIAVLKLGETQSTLPNLEFPFGLVKFTLVKGSGPVHITGLQFPDVFDVNMDEEEEVSGQDWIWLGLNITLIMTCNLFLPSTPPTAFRVTFPTRTAARTMKTRTQRRLLLPVVTRRAKPRMARRSSATKTP